MHTRRGFFGLLTAAALAPVLLVEVSEEADAHPGAVTRQGCHRVGRTGKRHCHARSQLRRMRNGRWFAPWGTR